MKVLVGCEFSGMVRDAFINLGHDAISCDLLPSLSSRGPHYQGNIFDILYSENWDIFICFPPCTYLSVVGNRWLDPVRIQLREDAFSFAMRLFNAPVKRVCMENPSGYINTHFRKPDQIINPYQFGDNQLKRTCLWLRGLPKLHYTVQYPVKPLPVYIHPNGKKVYFVEACRNRGSGLSRSCYRSKTFPGVASAMACQWGGDDSSYFYEKY